MKENNNTNGIGERINANNSLAIEVSQREFDELQKGIKHFVDVPVNQDTYPFVLENIDGNLILNCEEMPSSFFGCYFWNRGVFPYMVRGNIKYIIAQNKDKTLLLINTGCTPRVLDRYDFLEDNSLKTNPNGEACVWCVRFDVEIFNDTEKEQDFPNDDEEFEVENAGIGEKIPGKNKEEFDPDQGHGSHLQCVDENVDALVDDFLNAVKSLKTFIGKADVKAKDGDTEYETQIVMLSSDEKKDITFRTLLEAKEDGNELKAFFPYVVNETGVPMTLKKIYEFSNGIEAILCCDYNDEMEFRFFDMDYPLHKAEYKIGETYNFALSAIAYDAEKVPDSAMSFEIDPETVEKMHKTDPSVVHRDSDGNALPMKMSMEIFVTCLQHDDRYPDDAEFWSPVKSRVRKVAILNRDFYRMDISVYHDEDDENLIIPLAARTSFFKKKPSKADSVRGYLWLQGRRIVRTSAKFEKDPHNYPGNGYNDEQQTFILKWNPAISSISMQDHVDGIQMIHTGYFNWSVYEWERAKMGDRFYMIRVGEGNTGVVMSGIFTSQPYASQDWNPNRNSRKIYYMDMKPNFIVNPEVQAIITTEQLQDAIPDFEWRKGHSGQLLNSEQAKKLEKLFADYIQKMLDVDDETNAAIINVSRHI